MCVCTQLEVLGATSSADGGDSGDYLEDPIFAHINCGIIAIVSVDSASVVSSVLSGCFELLRCMVVYLDLIRRYRCTAIRVTIVKK